MNRHRQEPQFFWRVVIGAQAAVWAVLSALRLLGVFSFRMKYVPLLALIFVAADLVLYAVRYDRRHRADAAYQSRRRIFFVLLLVTLLASVPLFTDYIVEGHDIQFHLFRIEGVKDGLMDGQFPVRIHPNTLYGNGYANPEFYPELLLYFPAALRLCGFSIMGAYKAFLFALNALTAFLAYYAFSRMFRSRKTGVVGSAVYTLSLYRLVNLYTRAAVGEASAMTFLPLIVFGLYEILTADTSRQEYGRSFLPLTLGMTGLVATHLLSCEMVLPLLAVCCVVCYKKTFQPKRLLAIGKAAGCTVLLALCFFVPMLDYLGHDTYQVFQYSVTNRAHEALNLAQLFPLLPNGAGESIPLSDGIQGEMPFGPGFVGAMLLIAYPVLRARQKSLAREQSGVFRTRLPQLSYALTLLLLFLTTNLFPWGKIYELGGVFAQLASMLQFPWRMLAPATALLAVVACACFELLPGSLLEPSTRRIAAFAFALALLVTPLAYCDRLLQDSPALHVEFYEDLEQPLSIGDAEYLPYGGGNVATYRTDEPVELSAGLSVVSFTRDKTHLSVELQNDSAASGTVDLPLIYYLGYVAFDAEGDAFPLAKGKDCRIRLTVPTGYAGTVRVSFSERPLWRAAEILSLLTAAAIVIFAMRARKRKAACSPVSPIDGTDAQTPPRAAESAPSPSRPSL